MNLRICSVDQCHKTHLAKGYCNSHYRKLEEKQNKPLYKIWCNMLSRCYQRNTPYFKYYGERGIKVCDRWRHSYENFSNDMGLRPSSDHSLDRIDVNGNYEPNNCRWATQLEQIYNRGLNSNNTSGYKGISWAKNMSRWESSITHNYKKITLGYFIDINDALEARKKAEAIYHGSPETTGSTQ